MKTIEPPAPDLPLVKRFVRSRWTETRRRIDAMQVGQTETFPESEYINAKSAVERLCEAYEETRVWTLTTRDGQKPTVRRTK